MKVKILLVWLFIICAAWIYSAQQTASHTKPMNFQKPPAKQSTIDLAFCLDTTGSMSGLIEGAKQKIWSIVNTVASAQPKPTLRIAFVAYRDHGDAYITQVYDFTSDLEKMYSQLREFSAGGGGDTPEDVNRALDDAVNHLQWSQNSAALKIIYLVGDAPPHMDYQEPVDYRSAAKKAAASGIIINTVQCGQMQETRPVWQEISRLAEGKYAAIDQSGGMIAINSPYDAALSRLSSELSTTYVPYGNEGGEKKESQLSHDREVAASPAVAADRAATKSSDLYRNESWDLVDAIKNKIVNLKDLRSEQLPPALQKKPVGEQEAYLDQKAQDRDKLQRQIQDLSRKRDEYVAKETKKLGASADDSFDAQVLQTLKDQGKDKGIEFQK
jgi:Mg-chelatase subunit ChlD